DGYVGNIVMILDLEDPRRPREAARWWMPGQWVAGGETPAWSGRAHRCHNPIRLGTRLYVSYWHGGFVILDIEDPATPRLVSGLDWSPPFPAPTHTTLPIPFPLRGRRVLVVTDEDVAKLAPGPPSFLWLVDITDETRPVPFASFQVDGVDGAPQPEFTGCHQPCEEVRGTEIPVAWFAHGLRIVDIADPHAPREVASFVPAVPEGQERVCSNDVCVDARGLIYLIDRGRGLHRIARAWSRRSEGPRRGAPPHRCGGRARMRSGPAFAEPTRVRSDTLHRRSPASPAPRGPALFRSDRLRGTPRPGTLRTSRSSRGIRTSAAPRRTALTAGSPAQGLPARDRRTPARPTPTRDSRGHATPRGFADTRDR